MITSIVLGASAVIGVITAWLAGQLLRGNRFGLPLDALAGVFGAVIGGYALRNAGLDFGSGLTARLIVAFLGATIVLLFVHILIGRDRQRSWS